MPGESAKRAGPDASANGTAPAASVQLPAGKKPRREGSEGARRPQAAADVGARLKKPPKHRQRPVRDSFTMPEADFGLIATLKARAMAAGRETKKSELLRAGLHALAALDAKKLLGALGSLEPVKIGRPKKTQR